MKKKLKIAIIGQGRSGRDIHGAFFKTEQNDMFDVMYVVERDELRRRRAEEEYPSCKGLASVEDLYGIEGIDLVVNAGYSDDHYPITLDLINHGFNVVVEKPFARTRGECDTLISMAKKKGVVLAVFQQTFLAPIYKETCRVIDSGILGDIKQVSIRYNGFSRRWDWQTLLSRCAGSIYNTGPHPIGMGLGFLDFAPDWRVAFSRLDTALTSGDGEDYAKIILAASGKPVVDIEMSSVDAFNDYNILVQGSLGTYKCTTTKYQMKYITPGENPERPVIFESLKDENGYPIYCSEQLITHEEAGDFHGSAFDTAVCSFYTGVYNLINDGTPMEVTPEMAAQIISVIEQVHAENPLPLIYPTVNG
ncbi:MAG: Gfo/Idh/MocA family oxidoreductase [Clostridia bacterium]|nr:Gfo/Idh/MocA family oxidoreductase [Clostridia bacterium]MBQ8371751.1 Gfo/Idh/MocA family oxidoreductase [Clostridia bacterium]